MLLLLLLLFSFNTGCLASLSFLNSSSLSSDNSLVSIHTSSYFQYREGYFEAKGNLVELVLKPGASGCELDPNSFPPSFSETIPNNNNNTNDTIIFLGYDGGACRLRCFSEAFPLVLDFSSKLASWGYNNPNTFLVFRSNRIKDGGDLGSPFFDYKCRDFRVSNNGPPPRIHFQLAELEEYNQTLEYLRNTPDLSVHVIKENGAWNDAFFSWQFLLIMDILDFAMIVIIAMGLYQYYLAYLDNTLAWDIKHFIFTLALINCYITIYKVNFLWICSRNFSLYNNIQESLAIVAFYTLLFFWSLLFQRLTGSRKAYFLSVVVVTSGIILFSIFAFRIANNLGLLGDTVIKTFLVHYFGVIVQAFSSITFLFFALFFFRRAEISSTAAQDTANMLKFLQWLAIVGFATFFIFAFLDSPIGLYLRNFATIYALESVFYLLFYEIRFCALLLIIKVGKPMPGGRQRPASWIEKKISLVKGRIPPLLFKLNKPSTSSTA